MPLCLAKTLSLDGNAPELHNRAGNSTYFLGLLEGLSKLTIGNTSQEPQEPGRFSVCPHKPLPYLGRAHGWKPRLAFHEEPK